MKCEYRGCNCEGATVERAGKKFCSPTCADMETVGAARGKLSVRPSGLLGRRRSEGGSMTHHSQALVLAIGLAASIVACQRRESSTGATGADTTPAPEAEAAAPGATAAAYDLQFLDGMSKHHQIAVDMAKMGQGKFASAELEASAKKIIEKQQKEITLMKQWRDQWFSGAPASENMEMPGMDSSKNMDMSHMQTMSGKELDLMFIDMMIPHHQRAIEMARDALVKAEQQEIKDLAQTVITDQQKEIAQLEQWKSRWSAGK